MILPRGPNTAKEQLFRKEMVQTQGDPSVLHLAHMLKCLLVVFVAHFKTRDALCTLKVSMSI